jgi:hypothetical protein
VTLHPSTCRIAPSARTDSRSGDQGRRAERRKGGREGRRKKGEGEGRREKGEGRREKGEGRRKRGRKGKGARGPGHPVRRGGSPCPPPPAWSGTGQEDGFTRRPSRWRRADRLRQRFPGPLRNPRPARAAVSGPSDPSDPSGRKQPKRPKQPKHHSPIRSSLSTTRRFEAGPLEHARNAMTI